MMERFSYEGPATIGGVHFRKVSLLETTAPLEAVRTWGGSAAMSFDALRAGPPLFGMPDEPQLLVELPDGRQSEVVASVEFVDGRWRLEVTGVGPAPGASRSGDRPCYHEDWQP